MKAHHPVLFCTMLALLTPSFAQTVPAPAEPKSVSPTATIEARIAANEKATWEALKRHDVAAYDKLSLKGGWGIFDVRSVHITQKVAAQFPGAEILDYKMDDIQVAVLNERTAIIRYKIFARMSSKGVESPAQWLQASTVWVDIGGGWKAAMYQEAAVPAKP